MLASLLGPLVLAAATTPPPDLTDQTFAHWRDFLRPRATELCFETVPWRTTLWGAAVEAQAQDKPVLLWAMNGHPLACT
jgi:hypothetical protein